MSERRFDPLALLAGLFFAGLGLMGLIGGADTVGDHVAWLWPLLFVVLGAGFLGASALRVARRTGSDGEAVEDTTTFL